MSSVWTFSRTGGLYETEDNSQTNNNPNLIFVACRKKNFTLGVSQYNDIEKKEIKLNIEIKIHDYYYRVILHIS